MEKKLTGVESRKFFRSKEEREMDRIAFEKKFAEFINSMAESSSLFEMDDYIQHGNTSTLLHCIAVSYFSYCLARKCGFPFCETELLRGALLHDYFLYDWHTKREGHNLHGFTHPGRALQNAKKHFRLSEREQDIIKKHMFPLTPYVPKYRETILVCLVDKWCSTYEVFHKNPYRDLRSKFLPGCEICQQS